MVPLGRPAAAPTSTPYSSRVGSSRRARSTSWVGIVIRGPPSAILVLYLDLDRVQAGKRSNVHAPWGRETACKGPLPSGRQHPLLRDRQPRVRLSDAVHSTHSRSIEIALGTSGVAIAPKPTTMPVRGSLNW
jgi:hypothetical protein